MKIRSDFVTNSSSSSFLVFEINSKKLLNIFKKYNQLFEGSYEIGECDISNGQVYLSSECWLNLPSCKEEIIDRLIEVLNVFEVEFYNDETGEYEYEEIDEDEWDLDCDCNELIELIKELREREKELTEDIDFAEVTYEDVGYGGDSDERFFKENYSEDKLQAIYTDIAEEKGIDIKDITDEDFEEYVSGAVSVSTRSFTYDKEKNKEEFSENFRLGF